jgi:hypothetical protein
MEEYPLVVSKKPQHTFPAAQSLPSSQPTAVVPPPLHPSCVVHEYSKPPRLAFAQQTCEPTAQLAVFFPHQISLAGGLLTSGPASVPPLEEEEDDDDEVEPPLDELEAPPLDASPLELAPGSVPACEVSAPAKSSLEPAPLHAAIVAATMKDPMRLIFMTAEL